MQSIYINKIADGGRKLSPPGLLCCLIVLFVPPIQLAFRIDDHQLVVEIIEVVVAEEHHSRLGGIGDVVQVVGVIVARTHIEGIGLTLVDVGQVECPYNPMVSIDTDTQFVLTVVIVVGVIITEPGVGFELGVVVGADAITDGLEILVVAGADAGILGVIVPDPLIDLAVFRAEITAERVELLQHLGNLVGGVSMGSFCHGGKTGVDRFGICGALCGEIIDDPVCHSDVEILFGLKLGGCGVITVLVGIFTLGVEILLGLVKCGVIAELVGEEHANSDDGDDEDDDGDSIEFLVLVIVKKIGHSNNLVSLKEFNGVDRPDWGDKHVSAQ